MSIETERRWKEWMEQQSRVLQDAADAASAAGVELSPVSLEAATARSPEEVLRMEALLAKEIAEKAMRRSDALTAKAHTLTKRARQAMARHRCLDGAADTLTAAPSVTPDDPLAGPVPVQPAAGAAGTDAAAPGEAIAVRHDGSPVGVPRHSDYIGRGFGDRP